MKSPPSAELLRTKETVKAILARKKYKESASQTSPNFVRQAKAAAKAKKAALAKTEDIPTEMKDFVAKAKEAAINATKGTDARKKKQVMDMQQSDDNVMDIPTPAMLEQMRKKEAAQAEKKVLAAQKRKQMKSKTAAGAGGLKRVKS